MESTAQLKIKGMTCSGCVASVKRVLEGLPGVKGAEVSLAEGRATIRYEAGTANTAQFKQAVQDAGFEAL
ncbi:MAG TPA: heavy metal-associated domain-containing protein [Burkholderiales bacterium]|nr:heavy metal-associated domain-containing protein [Burkholderiales bacterium]